MLLMCEHHSPPVSIECHPTCRPCTCGLHPIFPNFFRIALHFITTLAPDVRSPPSTDPPLRFTHQIGIPFARSFLPNLPPLQLYHPLRLPSFILPAGLCC